MKRREILKTMAGFSTIMLIPGISLAGMPRGRHLVSLSFDDGFRKSSIKTAEIFEKHGFKACFNVLAGRSGENELLPPDEWHSHEVGDWDLWNELSSRGHEIMPHGLVHADLSALPLRLAQNLVLTSLEIFTEKLKGFDPSKSVFNFPYNRSTPELEEWLRTKVLAIRTGGPAVNPLPRQGLFRLTCTTGGEENQDDHLNAEVDRLLALQEGWLIYNTHGLDDEGWGPVSAKALDSLLYRLRNTETAEVVNPAEMLNKVS